MAKDKYGKEGAKGKTDGPSNYNEPKVVKNLYNFFQKMEAENQIPQREPKPESMMEVNKKRLRKVFRINMGREPHF